MSRKKNNTTTSDSSTIAIEPGEREELSPSTADQGAVEAGTPAKNWGPSYKAVFVSAEKGFELGENRRFNQRIFLFKEKPVDTVLAALKEAGFTYRAIEKAWTIPANSQTRLVSDQLAREFAGQS